jgi:hypothetical protein
VEFGFLRAYATPERYSEILVNDRELGFLRS